MRCYRRLRAHSLNVTCTPSGGSKTSYKVVHTLGAGHTEIDGTNTRDSLLPGAVTIHTAPSAPHWAVYSVSDKSSGRGPSLSLNGNHRVGAQPETGAEGAREPRQRRCAGERARGLICTRRVRLPYAATLPLARCSSARECWSAGAEAALCFCVGPTAIPNTALYVVCTAVTPGGVESSPRADVFQ
jgi:hypothetical protein